MRLLLRRSSQQSDVGGLFSHLVSIGFVDNDHDVLVVQWGGNSSERIFFPLKHRTAARSVLEVLLRHPRRLRKKTRRPHLHPTTIQSNFGVGGTRMMISLMIRSRRLIIAWRPELINISIRSVYCGNYDHHGGRSPPDDDPESLDRRRVEVAGASFPTTSCSNILPDFSSNPGRDSRAV